MTLAHAVTGYFRKTGNIEREYNLPADQFGLIKELVHVPPEDEQAVGTYPIVNGSVLKVSQILGKSLNTDLYDWFLEPSE